MGRGKRSAGLVARQAPAVTLIPLSDVRERVVPAHLSEALGRDDEIAAYPPVLDEHDVLVRPDGAKAGLLVLEASGGAVQVFDAAGEKFGSVVVFDNQIRTQNLNGVSSGDGEQMSEVVSLRDGIGNLVAEGRWARDGSRRVAIVNRGFNGLKDEELIGLVQVDSLPQDLGENHILRLASGAGHLLLCADKWNP
jgi:hypothetical protein